MLRAGVRKVKSSPNLKEWSANVGSHMAEGMGGAGAAVPPVPRLATPAQLHTSPIKQAAKTPRKAKGLHGSERSAVNNISPIKSPLAAHASMRNLASSVLGTTRRGYEEKRLTELKTLLKDRGYSTTGKKEQLVERLVESDLAGPKKVEALPKRRMTTSAARAADPSVNSMAGTSTEKVSTISGKPTSVDNVTFGLAPADPQSGAVPPYLPDLSKSDSAHPLHAPHDIHTAAENERLDGGRVQLTSAHSTHHGGGPLHGDGIEEAVGGGERLHDQIQEGKTDLQGSLASIMSTGTGASTPGWASSFFKDVRDDLMMVKSSIEESAQAQAPTQETRQGGSASGGQQSQSAHGEQFDPDLQLTAEQSSGLYALFGIVGGGFLVSKFFGGKTAKKRKEH